MVCDRCSSIVEKTQFAVNSEVREFIRMPDEMQEALVWSRQHSPIGQRPILAVPEE